MAGLGVQPVAKPKAKIPVQTATPAIAGYAPSPTGGIMPPGGGFTPTSIPPRGSRAPSPSPLPGGVVPAPATTGRLGGLAMGPRPLELPRDEMARRQLDEAMRQRVAQEGDVRRKAMLAEEVQQQRDVGRVGLEQGYEEQRLAKRAQDYFGPDDGSGYYDGGGTGGGARTGGVGYPPLGTDRERDIAREQARYEAELEAAASQREAGLIGEQDIRLGEQTQARDVLLGGQAAGLSRQEAGQTTARDRLAAELQAETDRRRRQLGSEQFQEAFGAVKPYMDEGEVSGGSGGGTLPDTAQAAAFGRAKDRQALITQGALKSLQQAMASRGISGSGIEAEGTADVIGGGAMALGEADREQILEQLRRGYEVEDRNVAAKLMRRGQNVGLLGGVLSNYGRLF